MNPPSIPSTSAITRPAPAPSGPTSSPRPVALADKVTAYQVLPAFWLPIVAIVLRCASAPTANASYLLVAAYALTGVRQAIVSLYLCWFFNMLNHSLFPVAGMAAIFRYAIILSAFVSVLIHGRGKRWRNAGWLVPATMIVCAFLIFHSLGFSEQHDVSTLKAVSFSMTVLAMAFGWPSLDDRNRRLTTAFLFGSLAVIALVSLPIVPLAAGYSRHRTLFQGILVHSMNFGPTIAVLGAATVATWLTEQRLRIWQLGLLAICLFEVGLSKSRIGGLALVAGIALGLAGEAVRLCIASRAAGKQLRIGRMIAFALMSLVLVAAAWRQVSAQISEFVRKGLNEEVSLEEAALASRGAKLNEMLANIDIKPLLGFGFGIQPGADYFGMARDPVFNLPVMATVEKGIMPVAVIEETGVIGGCFIFPWLLILIARATRAGLVQGTVLWAVLVTNLAEACFFSPGGQGMLQLTFAFWACTAAIPKSTTVIAHPHTLRRAA